MGRAQSGRGCSAPLRAPQDDLSASARSYLFDGGSSEAPSSWLKVDKNIGVQNCRYLSHLAEVARKAHVSLNNQRVKAVNGAPIDKFRHSRSGLRLFFSWRRRSFGRRLQRGLSLTPCSWRLQSRLFHQHCLFGIEWKTPLRLSRSAIQNLWWQRGGRRASCVFYFWRFFLLRPPTWSSSFAL